MEKKSIDKASLNNMSPIKKKLSDKFSWGLGILVLGILFAVIQFIRVIIYFFG